MCDMTLAPLIELFAVCGNQSICQDRTQLTLVVDMVADVKELNRLRNTFIHFLPGGLSSEVSHALSITRLMLLSISL